MDKGIRPRSIELFKQFNPQFLAGTMTGTKFRAEVIGTLMEEFGCTLAAAATHYNYAKKELTKTNPEMVVNLGRPEGKNNGGRKKKEVAAAAEQVAGTPTQEDATRASVAALQHSLANTIISNLSVHQPPPKQEAKQEEAAPPPAAQDEPAAAVLYTVRKKADGSVFQEGLTLEAATALRDEHAAGRFKPKLVIDGVDA